MDKKNLKSLIREMKIKTTLIFHLTQVRMAKLKKKQNQVTAHSGEDVNHRDCTRVACGNANFYNHIGNQFGGFSKYWE